MSDASAAGDEAGRVVTVHRCGARWTTQERRGGLIGTTDTHEHRCAIFGTDHPTHECEYCSASIVNPFGSPAIHAGPLLREVLRAQALEHVAARENAIKALLEWGYQNDEAEHETMAAYVDALIAVPDVLRALADAFAPGP